MLSGPRHPVCGTEALARLKAGNERFASNTRAAPALTSHQRRDELLDGQSPFAIILSCADSRVPSEIVFDCGLGDLFVVRVAGNIVAPSIVGSVEYAAATFGTELVVVMGHSRCGAVGVTVDALRSGEPAMSDNVRSIVDRIAPFVRDLASDKARARDQAVAEAVRANARASASQLRHGSRILEERLAAGRLLVASAEYALETGCVEFFE